MPEPLPILKPIATQIAMPHPVLRVRDLSFAHPGQPALLRGWSADIPTGLTLIEGDVGAGKTSLLRLLAGEWIGEFGNGGELCLCGQRFDADPAAYRQQVCWFDPCDPADDDLTPAGWLAAFSARYPGTDAGVWQRLIVAFGLTPHLAKPLYALSTGTRRKAGLALALSAGCALTLLDEPAAGLDGPSLRFLSQALNEAAGHPDRAIVVAGSPGLEGLKPAGTIQLCSPASGG